MSTSTHGNATTHQGTHDNSTLEHGTEIVVLLHPDYQYDPRLVTALASMARSRSSPGR
mgnify:CR=1 FL=1